MGVRAIKARIHCDGPTLQHLWRTHSVFNDRLKSLLGKLFAMRRGELGVNAEHRKACEVWMEFILSRPAKDAVYLLNAVSITNWKSASATKKIATKPPKALSEAKQFEKRMREVAAAMTTLVAASAKSQLAYEKTVERDGLPDSLFEALTRDAVAIMSGHGELLAQWEKEQEVWLREKAEWESDEQNKKYIALRSEFAEFEATVGGKAGKRRGRWHLYIEWLSNHPQLAAWRGGPASVAQLDAAAKARIAKAKPWKKRSAEAKEFWDANPELAALDRLHGAYERRFAPKRKTNKRGKTTKSASGFKRRPTLTLPAALRHPRWVHFNAPKTKPIGYRSLVLPKHAADTGSIELQILTGEKVDGEHPARFVPLKFHADARLSCFKSLIATRTKTKGKDKGKTTESEAFLFRDDHLHKHRPAAISGAKLILDDIKLDAAGNLQSATPFIVFACTIEDEPISELAKKIKWNDTGETTKAGKAKKTRTIPRGLVSCAVDLGLRNLGFITIARNGATKKDQTHRELQVIRSRNQKLSEGPDLANIGQHKREIRNLRRLRGKPVKGEQSHTQLQEHIDGMSKDRFKKAARAIINIALNVDGAKDSKGKPYPRADVIVLEKLAGFIPDAEKERGINRALASWNRGQLVQRIKEVAADAGYKGRVFEVFPAGTSQCCSRCGELGRRYSIVREDGSGKPVIRFGWVEKLFACAACGYRANSDHNASVNLHHVFAGGNEAVSAFYKWRDLGDGPKKTALRELDAELLPSLQRENRLPLDTPF